MARTRKQPETGQPPAPVENGQPAEVLTLAEAAAYLRLSEKDVIAATSTQGLPGRFVSGEWRFLKDAVRQWLSASQPTDEMRKVAQLAAAGSLRDDPDLEDLVEEIYRKRGRPITEDGSYRLFHGLSPEDFKK
jgi:hypothetical protein